MAITAWKIQTTDSGALDLERWNIPKVFIKEKKIYIDTIATVTVPTD